MISKYSITSNESKLLKHLDSLAKIQQKKPSPILLHLSTTNKCDRNCIHCCFSERDKSLELPFSKLKKSIDQFVDLGIKSIELTGGGEPTQYSNINALIEYIVDEKKLPLGMNTNAMSVDRITINNWKKFDWVRVAMNIFDDKKNYVENMIEFEGGVDFIKKYTNITACYIVPKEIGTKNLFNMFCFAIDKEIPTRIAPDCIQKKPQIKKMIDRINKFIDTRPNLKNSQYLFVSDFNVFLGKRENNVCLTHMIKPFLYTDGWVYCCPSSELAIENGRTMQRKFRVCRMEDVKYYYTHKFEAFHHTCSYCKYTAQNNLLAHNIRATKGNAFC